MKTYKILFFLLFTGTVTVKAQQRINFNFSLDYSYHEHNIIEYSDPISLWIDPFYAFVGNLNLSYKYFKIELGVGFFERTYNDRIDLTDSFGFRITSSATTRKEFYQTRIYLIDYLRIKSFDLRPFFGLKKFSGTPSRISSRMVDYLVLSPNRTIRVENYDNFSGNLWSQFGFEIKATNRKRFYPSLLFGVEYAPHNFIELIDRGQIDGNPSTVRLGLSGINYFGSIRITI